MKRFLSLLALGIASLASAATLTPIQLLNPTGSTAGQAIVSTGASTAPGWATVQAGSLTPVASNTVIANVTASSASPTAVALPSCSATGSALLYTTSTGFGCATGYAPLASPTFTGTPAAPTASVGTNTTQIATTAFVQGQYAAPPAIGNTTANTGAFTTLAASSTVSGTGFSTYLASPPAIGGTAANSGKFTTLQATSTITPSSTAGIAGTTTNDNANAGSIGEEITNTGTSISLTNSVAANVTSISLTAGDWLVMGSCQFGPGASTVTSQISAGISQTSATMPSAPLLTQLQAPFTNGSNQNIPVPTRRIKLASTTTIYLVALAAFTTSTMAATCTIDSDRLR